MKFNTQLPKFVQSTLALGALLLALATPARATQITSTLTVDNFFSLYISTNDSTLGTFIGSGTDWPTTYSFNTALSSGVTNYYLHIVAGDQGGIAALIGQFTLSDTNFSFANGTQSLLTGSAYWQGSTSGFGSSYQTPIDLGVNGVGPWGLRPGISTSAHFIWVQDADAVNTAYFSTTIHSNTASVPDSSATFAMLGLGLTGLVALRRKFARG